MRVLGVDAGTIKAGLCVLDERERLIYSSQLKLFGAHPAQRVAYLHARVREAVTYWHVDQVCVESPVTYGRTRDQGAKWVGAGYHAVMVLAVELSWPTPLEINPTTAKVTLTGSSTATKETMQQYAALRWPDHAGMWGDDEADACGVALAGLAMVREQALLAAAGKGERR